MVGRTAGLTFAAALGFFLAAHSQSQSPAVRIYYLGHAAFLLEFPTGLTVLTDYGESRAYGLDSPVFGLGAVRPDVVTRSHDHPDHAGGALSEGVATVVTGGERFEAKGVRITPIPTFERSLDAPDNVSFLVEYGGLKILHLGDCQALMQHAADPGMPERIRELYPDTYDVVFLPIGFIDDILTEAAEFATLLDARRLVPMHYWRPADRDAFLDVMRGRLDARGREYLVTASPHHFYALSGATQRDQVVEIVGLTAAPVPHPSGAYLGEPLPGAIPTLFAAGIVSTLHWEHSTPAFAPSGDLVLWTEISDESRIRMSELNGGRWGPARVAPWSGSFPDFYPSVSADSRRVYFSSYRPWSDASDNPGYGITIWRVDRNASGWADPERLPESIATGNEFGFSLSADGTLYFTRAAGDTFKIFRAERSDGGYGEPVMLPPEINSATHQDGPFITPDDRVLLFESIRPDGFGGADLYVSVRGSNGDWSEAVNLGPVVNTSAAERFARISNDGRYLFFGSDRNGDRGDIFWISVDAVEPLRCAVASGLQVPSSQPLFEAVKAGDQASVRSILREQPWAVRATDELGRIPLHWAASLDLPDPGLIPVILQTAADPQAEESGGRLDVADLYGLTPLHLAARHGNEAAVDALLRGGANVEARTPAGYTALNLAQDAGHQEVVGLLIRRGAVLAPPEFPPIGGEFLGMPKPGRWPEVFAPGIVSTAELEHSPAVVAPGGKEIYWTPVFRNPLRTTIYVTRMTDGTWTAPTPVVFSTSTAIDGVPALTADGRTMYFPSFRSVGEGADSQTRNIWMVQRDGGEWGAPELLAGISSGFEGTQVSVAPNGNLYFTSARPGGLGDYDLYVARYEEGRFQEPENLGAPVNTASGETDPYIAPDESYLIFTGFDRDDSMGGADLYVSFRNEDGSWSESKNLGPRVNSGFNEFFPNVSPDGRYLFFDSDRNANEDVFWVSADVIFHIAACRPVG